MVVGFWCDSPFGTFADVMVENDDAHRTLLAHSEDVAEFVSATYSFDSTELGPVTAALGSDALTVSAPVLQVTARLGGPAPFDWLLRAVPGRLATAPTWLRLIAPVAAVLVHGVRPAGSAGNGRREYYGVRRTRRIASISGTFRGADLGGLTPLSPPVNFGFSSAPRTPQLVSVTSTMDLPA